MCLSGYSLFMSTQTTWKYLSALRWRIWNFWHLDKRICYIIPSSNIVCKDSVLHFKYVTVLILPKQSIQLILSFPYQIDFVEIEVKNWELKWNILGLNQNYAVKVLLISSLIINIYTPYNNVWIFLSKKTINLTFCLLFTIVNTST